MEAIETQSQQGHGSAQATEPKDEDQFAKQRFQNCLDEILKAVSDYPAECRPELLTAALEQTTKAKGAIDKIVAIEQEIRRACDILLDSKSRACIALLSELSSLSGITNVGVDFATDILYSTYGKKDVDQASKEFPDDANVAFMLYVFDLVRSVVKTDKKTFLREVSEQPKTIGQPQAAEPEDAEAGANTGIKALDDFLEGLSHEATAAAFGALRLMCVSDSTSKKMSEYLQKQVALLEDPDRVDDFTIDGQVLADIRWFLGFVRGAEIGNEEC